jgi:hypothetical protein
MPHNKGTKTMSENTPVLPVQTPAQLAANRKYIYDLIAKTK